jgi:hypothetical protein
MLVRSPLLGVSVVENIVENDILKNQTMCCAKVVLIPRHIEWC